MEIRLKNRVTEVDTRPADEALEHFSAKLRFETDCWDVHATQALEDRGFVLVDVRSPSDFEAGHLPRAVNIPHAALTRQRLAEYPEDELFVVYCAGAHCNGSTRAAIRLAAMGRPVKEMIGGTAGWVHEGYELVRLNPL